MINKYFVVEQRKQIFNLRRISQNKIVFLLFVCLLKIIHDFNAVAQLKSVNPFSSWDGN